MTASSVLVTGASGAGTTTLGRALARHLSYGFLDADDFYWLPSVPPYIKKRPRDARNALLLGQLSDKTVVSGSVVDWGPAVEGAFDLVVYLTVRTEVRLERLRGRELARFGVVNEDFIRWAARYDSGGLDVRSRVLHERWLSGLSCPVRRLDGEQAVAQSLQEVVAAIGEC